MSLAQAFVNGLVCLYTACVMLVRVPVNFVL